MQASSLQLLNEPTSVDCAAATFSAVQAELQRAQKQIEIHMFVWRSDQVGNTIARALIDAADRGVSFLIKKDVGAFMYERIEMNRKSLFNVSLPLSKRLYYRLIRPTFPNTYTRDDRDGALGKALMTHQNGTIEWVDHTHSKYYVFDEKVLITGSINLEDRHLGYFDYMVKIDNADHVSRFRQRASGSVAMDTNRDLEFVFNRFNQHGTREFEIKPLFLRLIHDAHASIYLEMAYLGDPDVTAALISAALRGVTVTILASREANVGNDLNFRVIRELFQQAPMQLYLSDSMVHSKLILVDQEKVFFGSANASVFSMQKAVEMNIFIQRNTDFTTALRGLIQRRLDTSTAIKSLDEIPTYRAWLAWLQQRHQTQSK